MYTQVIANGYNSADNQQTSFLYVGTSSVIYDVTGTCNSQQVWTITIKNRSTGNSASTTIVADSDTGVADALFPFENVTLMITVYQWSASQSVLLLALRAPQADALATSYDNFTDRTGYDSDSVWLKDDPTQPPTPWKSLPNISTARIYIKIYDINNPSKICQNINVKINMGPSYVYYTNTSDWNNGIIDYTCSLSTPPDQLTIEVYENAYYQGTTVTISKTQYNGKTYSIGLIPKSTPTTYTVNVDVENNSNQPLEGVAIAVDNLTTPTPTPTPTSPTYVNIEFIPELTDGTILTNAQVLHLNTLDELVSSQLGPVSVQIIQGTKGQIYSAQLSGYTFNNVSADTSQSGTQIIYGVQNPIQVNKGSIYTMINMTVPNMNTFAYDSTCRPYIYIINPPSVANTLLEHGTMTDAWVNSIPFGTADWAPSQIGIVELAFAHTLWGPTLLFQTSPLPEQIISIVRYLYMKDYPNCFQPNCPIFPDSGTVWNLFNGTSLSTMQPISTRYAGFGVVSNVPTSWAYVITFSDNSKMGIGPFTSQYSLPSNLQYVYPLSSIPSCADTPPSWLYSG